MNIYIIYIYIFAICMQICIYIYIYLFICCFLTNIIPTFAGPHGPGFLVHWPVSVDFFLAIVVIFHQQKNMFPFQRDADLANEKWI